MRESSLCRDLCAAAIASVTSPEVIPPAHTAAAVRSVNGLQTGPGGRALGLGGTSQGAQIVLTDDNGSNNNLWRFL
ncbi:hypothetical protein ETD86_49730 [Nonomuraea turkmeniaca]|uniref:Ricin B lectin domain-containing protein n=1 Tax=Nonomuraea turkmeniaca TaxID=103838 RepID=A0A5S4EWH4_9ACTN|nr:hypothetical protein [Nonomuraea turkmeniaca]TMR07986.1 hypothetical protein ETD86_49730 [Nonomuraea turkmeniaca]